MRILLEDGVTYVPYRYKDESELEQMVMEHRETIFGVDSVLFPKKAIKARSGIVTIPDGFILLVHEKKWYILEIELASHPLYEHIVGQVSKFNAAIKNSGTRSKLIGAFYEEVTNNIETRYRFEVNGIKKESYKFLCDVVNEDPGVIVAIDERTQELDEICESLPFGITVLKFETYFREKIGIGVHIHCLDSLRDFDIEEQMFSEEQEKRARESTPAGRGEIRLSATERIGSWVYYCRDALKNLGNRASLKNIYVEVDRLRRNSNERKIKNPEAAIRNALEKNSRGNGLDIFEPEKIGSGIWLLKT